MNADTRTEKEKMLAGELYRAIGDEIPADSMRAALLCRRYNATSEDQPEKRSALLKELIGHLGERVVIRSPFYCDYGYNMRLGAGTFFNYNCVVLDVVSVEIGENTQIGTGVQILTADHPRDPQLRREGYESGIPVRIGHNVWIGSGAIILPGVAIGDDAIIGAGSVVTRDVAPGVTVVGNPARALR